MESYVSTANRNQTPTPKPEQDDLPDQSNLQNQGDQQGGSSVFVVDRSGRETAAPGKRMPSGSGDNSNLMDPS